MSKVNDEPTIERGEFGEVAEIPRTDSDGDGLDDRVETFLGTDPHDADTDGDGFGDGTEHRLGSDPLHFKDRPEVGDGNVEQPPESGVVQGNGDDGEVNTGAGDGSDQITGEGGGYEGEIELPGDDDFGTGASGTPSGTITATPTDTDGDGLLDIEEDKYGTDPLDPDSDRDGLGDGQEIDLGTDPLQADSDGDGVSDFLEDKIGTDPLDDGDTPTQDELDDVFD